MTCVLIAAALIAQSGVDHTFAVDTFIDRQRPDGNFGRDPTLLAGNGRVILLRFPELNVSGRLGVASATVSLTFVQTADVQLKRVSIIRRPWGEGGSYQVDYQPNSQAQKGEATWRSAQAGLVQWAGAGASSQTDARDIEGAFAQSNDSRLLIGGIEAAVQEMISDPAHSFGLRIELDGAANFWSSETRRLAPKLTVVYSDSPAGEVDVAVSFVEPRGFDGEAWPTDGAEVTWMAHVVNRGPAPATVSPTWYFMDQEIEGLRQDIRMIQPGETSVFTVEFLWQSDHADHSALPIRFSANTVKQDSNPVDNSLVVHMNALPLFASQENAVAAQVAVRWLNGVVFPQSRGAAAQTGCLERVRLVSTQEASAGAISGDDTSTPAVAKAIIAAMTQLPPMFAAPFEGQPYSFAGMNVPTPFQPEASGALWDTRDDGYWLQGLALPDPTGPSRYGPSGELPVRQLLSKTEVSILNENLGKLQGRTLPTDQVSSSVMIRVYGPDGIAIPSAEVTAYQTRRGVLQNDPTFVGATSANGSVFLVPKPSETRANPFGEIEADGSNSWMLLRFSANGVTKSRWLPVWALIDEYARGNRAVALIEYRIQLPSGALDYSKDLALNRIVTDSAGRFPAQLNALVDGNAATALELEDLDDGYWIEIDLGRDRLLGEISLVFEGDPWDEYRIVTYKTAQSPGSASLWADERNGARAAATAQRDDEGRVRIRYQATAVRSRYVRVIPLSREPVKLVGVHVTPVRG